MLLSDKLENALFDARRLANLAELVVLELDKLRGAAIRQEDAEEESK